MDRRKKRIAAVLIIITIIIIVFLVFRYIPFGERAKFIGTWHQPEFYGRAITFYSDGTCSDIGWPGTWEINDGELIITTKDGADTARWHYSFSENSRTLELTGRGSWQKWGN